MAIGYVDMVTHSRARGHSAAAALAYRFGVWLVDLRTRAVHDYRERHTREDIAATGIEASRGTPVAADAQTLANAIERAERRRDARILRDWKVALPHELEEPDRIDLAATIARDIAERYRTVTAWAVHRPGPQGDARNHHAHIVIPTRALGADGGFASKLRALDNPRSSGEEIAHLRNRYAVLTNLALERAGRRERIDVGEIIEGVAVESAGRDLVALARESQGRLRGATARDVITAAVAHGDLTTEHARNIAEQHRRRGGRKPRQRRWAESRRSRWRIRYALAELGDWPSPVTDPADLPWPAHLAGRDPKRALGLWEPERSTLDIGTPGATEPDVEVTPAPPPRPRRATRTRPTPTRADADATPARPHRPRVRTMAASTIAAHRAPMPATPVPRGPDDRRAEAFAWIARGTVAVEPAGRSASVPATPVPRGPDDRRAEAFAWIARDTVAVEPAGRSASVPATAAAARTPPPPVLAPEPTAHPVPVPPDADYTRRLAVLRQRLADARARDTEREKVNRHPLAAYLDEHLARIAAEMCSSAAAYNGPPGADITIDGLPAQARTTRVITAALGHQMRDTIRSIRDVSPQPERVQIGRVHARQWREQLRDRAKRQAIVVDVAAAALPSYRAEWRPALGDDDPHGRDEQRTLRAALAGQVAAAAEAHGEARILDAAGIHTRDPLPARVPECPELSPYVARARAVPPFANHEQISPIVADWRRDADTDPDLLGRLLQWLLDELWPMRWDEYRRTRRVPEPRPVPSRPQRDAALREALPRDPRGEPPRERAVTEDALESAATAQVRRHVEAQAKIIYRLPPSVMVPSEPAKRQKGRGRSGRGRGGGPEIDM